MSVQKTYLKSKPICKVKFQLPKENAGDAKKIVVVGEFNDWDMQTGVMKKQKDGSFVKTLDLKIGTEYQFRYVLDGERWENDPEADKYTPNNLCGADNSVLVV